MTKEEVIEKLIEQVNHNMDTFIGILGILNAALFASLSGCCIQAALTHNWKLINLFYWGSVLLVFVLASLFGGILL